MFNLFDKEMEVYGYKSSKILFFVFLIGSILLYALSFYYFEANKISILLIIISVYFFIVWRIRIRKYNIKLLANKESIKIYNYKNKKLKEFSKGSIKYTFLNVYFFKGARSMEKRKCLLLYYDFEPYENLEYDSYWNESNIIIIENKETINFIIDFLNIKDK